MRLFRLGGAVVLTLLSHAAFAQAVALRGGSTGFGAEYGFGLNERYDARIAYFGGSVSRSFTDSGVHYDSRMRFNTGLFLADFHPTSGSFRISAGLAYNGNKFDLTANGNGSGTVELNGTNYSISQVGPITGKLTFNKINPYFGVGWGNAAKSNGTGIFFSADLGGMLVNGDVKLNAACPGSMSAPQCAQFQSDLQAEQQQANDSLSFRKVYPVLSFGIGYRF